MEVILAMILSAGGLSGVKFGHISNFQGVYRNLHTTAVIIGGIFALIAIVISLLLIFQHLKSYTNPAEQKWIICILLMVPVYAIESIISLWQPKISIVCDILRNCYEAFALYAFGSYLVSCLGILSMYNTLKDVFSMGGTNEGLKLHGHPLLGIIIIGKKYLYVGGEGRVNELLEKERTKKHQLSEQLLNRAEESGKSDQYSFRVFFCNPSTLGEDLYTIVKFGIVQYMILKTLCSFLALLLEFLGVYRDGEFKWYYGYPYITFVINFSQMWALYCLVQLYNVTHHMLEPIKPLAKFISFKAIVFATWWQGVGIAMICYFGVLPKEGKIQNGIQDFLICIEMTIAAIAHIYVFPADPYHYVEVSGYGKVTSTETIAKLNSGFQGFKPASVERTEACVEAPGMSITESVQDVVIGGGEHVVKDVVLTISQAIEPVEKGVHVLQESFHHLSQGSNEASTTKLYVEEHIVKDM